MSDPNLSLLDALPEAALRLDGDSVTYLNEAARALLPELEKGSGLPGSMSLLRSAHRAAGVFTEGKTAYSFSASRGGDARLVLFRPTPPPVLSERELSGSVRTLRGLLGDAMAEVGHLTAPEAEAPSPTAQADLTRSFHRMFRLVGNLDFVRRSASPGGFPFRPVTMDLAGLCRQLAQDAEDLLRSTETDLWYNAHLTSLLIPGDPDLLRRLLLGLIANSARAARGGSMTLSLQLQGDRAVLTLSDSGPALTRREWDALLQREDGRGDPLPGQGAGLGLSVARTIAALHRGALLLDLGEDGIPVALISLPTGPLSTNVAVRTPPADETGGLDPLLVELSDVLPSEVYRSVSLE